MLNIKALKENLISSYSDEYNHTEKAIYGKVDGHKKAATHFEIFFRTDYRNREEIYIKFYSYSTMVMQVSLYKDGQDMWGHPDDLVINGLYSATTIKHIGWWVGLLRAWGVIPHTWDYYTIKGAWANRGEKSFGRLYL